MLNAQERSRQLSDLADAEKVKDEVAASKKFYRKLELSQFSAALIALALESTGKSALADEEILPVFFTEAACEWLMKLPNLYFFWRVVAKSYEWELTLDYERIGAPAVLRAMGEVREGVPRSFVECQLPPEELTAEHLAARRARGVFLTGPDETIVRNIVFSLDYTPDFSR
jgi:hypothetical protein